MTDRLKGFIVILKNDIREDDAESTIEAIKHIKGVIDVIPEIAGVEDAIAETRVRQKLIADIYELLTKT